MAYPVKDAERLLAVAPEDFVEERKRLVRELRDKGRGDDARTVAQVKKPTPVVLAVNRATRDRPQAAKDAARAAEQLGRTQLSGNADDYRELLTEMEQASALLAEVAVANLSRGKSASEAVRRRVHGHLRGALSSEETRRLLVRGTLNEEVETSGFDAFAGLPRPKQSSRQVHAKPSQDAERKRRALAQVRKDVAATREALAEAERRVREATRERDRLAEKLTTLEAKAERTA